MKKIRGLPILLVSLLNMIGLVVFPGSIAAEPYSHLSLDPNRIQWSYLLYEVKSTSADVTTEVRLEFPTQAEAKASMIESREGDPLPVPAAGCYKITVNTLLDSAFHAPVKSVDHLWFDPQDATALGRDMLRQGDEDFKKSSDSPSRVFSGIRRNPKTRRRLHSNPISGRKSSTGSILTTLTN